MTELKRPLVLTEWHHGGLFQSMVHMFEKRLGGMVFAPVGYEWQQQGFWKLSQNPDTIKQYLEPSYCFVGPDGFLYYYDKAELKTQRRIQFQEFLQTKFDIILCTLAEHEYSFRELQEKYQPQAKFIRLSGNWGENINWDNFKNYIDTTGLYRPPEHVNTVVINQEFPLEHFYYQPPMNHQRISNFMNNLKESPALQIWEALKPKLLDFDFKMHGSNGDDGMIDGLDKLAQTMRESAFVFMIKHHGEGYGHVIHNAYACGRPVITMWEHYKGKLASRFLKDDYSCILIDNLDLDSLVKKIRYWSQPENHRRMCENAARLFRENVSFDSDEKKFRKFMGSLK
jgi:hypothetical protein